VDPHPGSTSAETATEAMFRAAARRGYRVLSSGRVAGAALLAEQYQIIKDAYRAEGVPLENAHITVNRFAHITDSKEDGLRVRGTEAH
jgi:hypothetical protein